MSSPISCGHLILVDIFCPRGQKIAEISLTVERKTPKKVTCNLRFGDFIFLTGTIAKTSRGKTWKTSFCTRSNARGICPSKHVSISQLNSHLTASATWGHFGGTWGTFLHVRGSVRSINRVYSTPALHTHHTYIHHITYDYYCCTATGVKCGCCMCAAAIMILCTKMRPACNVFIHLLPTTTARQEYISSVPKRGDRLY